MVLTKDHHIRTHRTHKTDGKAQLMNTTVRNTNMSILSKMKDTKINTHMTTTGHNNSITAH